MAEYRMIKTRRSYGGKALPNHNFDAPVEDFISRLGKGKRLKLRGDVFLDGLQWKAKCGCKAKLHRSELRPYTTLEGSDFLEWVDYLDVWPCARHNENVAAIADYSY
jgi:hypothetical protein